MFGGAPPSAYHLLGNLVTLTSVAVLAHIQCIYITDAGL